MSKLPLNNALRCTPKERKVIQLFTRNEDEAVRDRLNQLATISGLSGTEKEFVAKWRKFGLRTEGDRRCFRHMCQLRGVKL